MIVKEYGKENKETMIFLHGGGLSWWNYRDVAERLKADYHIVIPILDGHADSDRKFTSIEDNADEIIQYIDQKYNGEVSFIAGLSVGVQILLEMLSKRSHICRYAIVESALVIPMKVTYMLIRPAFQICYGLIQKKWFSKLQFQSLKIKKELFELYYEDTCKISKESMIAMLKSNAVYQMKDTLKESKVKVLVLVGEKERGIMLRSAKQIHAKIPFSEMKIIEGYYHGELSMNHPDEYVNKLRGFHKRLTC